MHNSLITYNSRSFKEYVFLKYIFGVAVDDEGRIIITDCHNHRVQVFNPNGGFMFQFGRKGEGSGQFQCPTGVGVDPDGRIVVCERLGSRIQVRETQNAVPGVKN